MFDTLWQIEEQNQANEQFASIVSRHLYHRTVSSQKSIIHGNNSEGGNIFWKSLILANFIWEKLPCTCTHTHTFDITLYIYIPIFKTLCRYIHPSKTTNVDFTKKRIPFYKQAQFLCVLNQLFQKLL